MMKDCGLISIAVLLAASGLHSRMSDVSTNLTREARLRTRHCCESSLRLGVAVDRRRTGATMMTVSAGTQPRMELTVSWEECIENLRNQRLRIHGVAVNVFVVVRVALKRGIQIACERDADLHGTKRLCEGCDFHIGPPPRVVGIELLSRGRGKSENG